MEITVGTIVYSKAGHDKQKAFIVLKVENNFAYIADGKTRRVEKPKKKKFIHLQKTNKIVAVSPKTVTNKEVRKLLEQYKPGLTN